MSAEFIAVLGNRAGCRGRRGKLECHFMHRMSYPSINQGPLLTTTLFILISLSALFLFTRLYLKQCAHRGLWYDDYFLLSSWILLAAQAGLAAYVVSLGYGKQIIPPENIGLFPLPIGVLSTLLIVSNLFGKISFALTLLRIPERWMRLVLCGIVVTLTSTLIVSACLIWLVCLEGVPATPKRGWWCVDEGVSIKYNIFSCVYSAVMDLVLAFLPWKFLWSLQMERTEKVGVIVAMSMGVFAGAAAGIKSSALSGINANPDPTSSVPLVIWGNAEAAICIMAASIPILRALAKGSFRGQVPRGYETYLTNDMTETGHDGSTNGGGSRTQVLSLALPIQSPPPVFNVRRTFPRGNLEALDDTLTSDSPEPMAGCKRKEELDDDDSFEMTNYLHARAESPVDFVRR
ncbi:hypothetical protein QBC43DRAFT_378548 [Cladorrhinum sp. PSN259]|nr:hypothetical protein QBC43DRAFT_378548 [Cladorrhinum sp. PSN259]